MATNQATGAGQALSQTELQYVQGQAVGSIGSIVFGQKLGAGTFGTVWQVTGTDRLGRTRHLACKVSRFDGRNTAAAKEVITADTQGLQRQPRHPNIVQTVHIADIPGRGSLTHCLFTELCSGSLSDELWANHNDKGMPEEQVREWSRDIARALHYLHRDRRMAHLAVNPGNIMYIRAPAGQRSTYKLRDFSLAVQFPANSDDASVEARDVLARVRPEWAAPELESGRQCLATPCDVYGLGAAMVNALMGRVSHMTASKVSKEHVLTMFERVCKPSRNHKYDISPDMASLVTSMLRDRPRQRPDIHAVYYDAVYTGPAGWTGAQPTGPVPVQPVDTGVGAVSPVRGAVGPPIRPVAPVVRPVDTAVSPVRGAVGGADIGAVGPAVHPVDPRVTKPKKVVTWADIQVPAVPPPTIRPPRQPAPTPVVIPNLDWSNIPVPRQPAPGIPAQTSGYEVAEDHRQRLIAHTAREEAIPEHEAPYGRAMGRDPQQYRDSRRGYPSTARESQRPIQGPPDWPQIWRTHADTGVERVVSMSEFEPFTREDLQYLERVGVGSVGRLIWGGDYPRPVSTGRFGTVWRVKGVNGWGRTQVMACRAIRFATKGNTVQESVRHLMAETCALHSIASHPNIVDTVDIVAIPDSQTGFPYGMLCVFTEWCDGNLLEAIADYRNGVPEQKVLQCARDVVRGLYYLHVKQHIAHLDVRPANIMYKLGADGLTIAWKLRDFAAAVQYPSRLTTWGLRRGEVDIDGPINLSRGSLMWMAPELRGMVAGGVGGRLFPAACDVYSVGRVMVHCLLGPREWAVTGAEPLEVMRVFEGLAKGQPIWPRNPVSAGTARLITSMLPSEPLQRANIQDIYQALR